MACLFIEILSPAKVLSLVFQKDDTDIVSVVAAFEKTKKQSNRLIETNFEELPMVKNFLRKVTWTEHGHEYEGANLKRFDLAKTNVTSMKGQMVGLVRDHLMSRLEENQISILKSSSVILHTEGWGKDDDLLGDEEIRDLYNHFQVPLQNAGLSCGSVGRIW